MFNVKDPKQLYEFIAKTFNKAKIAPDAKQRKFYIKTIKQFKAAIEGIPLDLKSEDTETLRNVTYQLLLLYRKEVDGAEVPIE